MTSEFKKIKNNEDTHYVLETATSGATSAGAVATAPGKSRKDSILAQEKKETPKPRNFVAKNAKMGGAGQHKDKKKAEKQGDAKHKNKQFAEGANHSALQGWDEMTRDQKRNVLNKAGISDLYATYSKTPEELDDILHAARVKAQNQEDELSIGAGGRRELQRQAKQDFEEQRQQLHKEKMEMEKFAWEKANTEAERKHEMAKIEKEYLHDLRKLQMGHQQDMEKILHADTHELNKMKAEFNMRQAEREKDKPKEPESKPDDESGNNYDQDTGEPLKPGFSKPQQSNQWHTSQQVGYKPSKDNDDDIIDVEPKPNKPLSLKEKITVVKDPSKATGIQQTGGITHGSVYAGKPIKQPYRITPGATYTPGKPLPQSLQQKLDGKTNTGRAVDAKGRTQQQWLKLVKAKFPDAKIMQAKMMNGPVHAMLPDGRKLSWNKVEQGVAEGVAETMPMRDAQQVLNHYGADYFKTTHDTLYFSKYRKQFSIDRIRDNDSASAGSVNLSDLNAMVRKLRDMRVPLSPFGEGFNGEYDDEAGMAHTNLLTSARAVMGLLKTIEDKDNLPEWVQEKIAKAEMMLVGVWDYLQSQKEQGIDPQQDANETYGRHDRRDAYQRDYDSSVSGMGDRQSYAYSQDGGGNDERHDLDPSDWYIVKDGKMYKTSVYPRQEQEAIARGYSRTKEEAKSKADSVAEGVDPYFESLRARVEELAKK